MTVTTSERSLDLSTLFMTRLRSMSREEILKVLSACRDEFCGNCCALLTTHTSSPTRTGKSFDSISSGQDNLMATPLGSTYLSKFAPQSSNIGTRTISDEAISNGSSSVESVSNGYISNGSMAKSPLTPLASIEFNRSLSGYSRSGIYLNDGIGGLILVDDKLSEDQKDAIRVSQVKRKNDFCYIEKVHGRKMNILQGLELHSNVFDLREQENVVQFVYDLQRQGQNRQLRERTYSEPKRWMKGKGRITIQFGCCYNYAMDSEGNPPGIIREEEVDPIPPMFVQMIKRMVRWNILPSTCVPDSCIVNIYNEGDCIPPHVDHHDFLRPFCTLSFLAECDILFGSSLKALGPGEFSGPFSIPLPVGSVLILNGKGADVAKHCIPSVPAKRISITFRKMDKNKVPHNFSPNPELVGIDAFRLQRNKNQTTPESFCLESDDFPSLGSSSTGDNKSSRKGRRG